MVVNLEEAQAVESPAAVSSAWEMLDLPKKTTLIRVRWPFTIVCSYLLLYSQSGSISPVAIQGFVLLYLLSNLVLYFADERLFESFYFFVALVAFDTLFLTASMAVSGAATADFYIVCFATIFLCCICRDLRGLIGVAVLSPLLYGYFLMRSADVYEPTIYLRIVFPFVISLFYGYFAQVEHLQASLKEQTALAGHAAESSEEAKAQAAEKDLLLEELRQKTELLEKANRAKEEFLGVVSHELRTPLNVVMGYARLLKDKVLGEINPIQAEAAAKIMSRARDHLNMITDILVVAGLEAGETIAGQEVNLAALLDDLKSHYEIPEGKEVVLAWDYPADLPVVKTDGDKLKHALQNLLDNALKFTHRGAVTIAARYLPEAEQIMFWVADTGVGISQEHLPHIFDRFHQIDSSATRRYGGVGMGLYVVKKITETLGARIQVTSAPGQGSTFTLVLPYEKPGVPKIPLKGRRGRQKVSGRRECSF